VYVRAAGGAFAKVTGKPTVHGELTIKRLKRSTTYELKLVKVKAGNRFMQRHYARPSHTVPESFCSGSTSDSPPYHGRTSLRVSAITAR